MVLHGVSKYLIFLFFSFCFIGCETVTTYETKKEYNVKQGEIFNIYFTSNSSFLYCFKFEDLKNVKLIGNKVIDTESELCFGCDVILEYKFLAEKKGHDTLKYADILPTKDCNDTIDPKHISKVIIRIE